MTFFCRSCQSMRPMDRASKRVREGRREYDRCMDCEAEAQSLARSARREKINSRRRENWPKHAEKSKNAVLIAKYGIDLETWKSMLRDQGGRCAICESDSPRGRGWQTDHDHKTGSVRAILCHSCNSLLGHAMESPTILLAAFRYLCIHGGGAEAFLRSHFRIDELSKQRTSLESL